MSNMVQTVCGEISVDDLGFVLPHEHVFCAVQDRWLGLEACSTLKEMEWATRRVTADMQTLLRTHPFSNFDNLIRLEYEDSLEELKDFVEWGGNTLVDVSPSHGNLVTKDFHADIKKIADATGLNIIASSGFCCINDAMRHGEDQMTIDQLAQLVVDEIRIGFFESGIKAGNIKALIWELDNPLSTKYLTACGIAQQETGVPVYVHPDLMRETNHKVLDILEAAGADLTKVVLCHSGPLLDHFDYQRSLLDRGCYLAHDECGSEIFDNSREVLFHFPRDIDTIRVLKKYMEWGYEDQFLLSMDICFKNHLKKYGGGGYAHLQKNYIPLMKLEGFSDELIRKIVSENPKRLFTKKA